MSRVPPKPESPPKPDEPEPEPVPSAAEKLKAAVRDAQIKALGALKAEGDEAALYDETYAQLVQDWPAHVPLLSQRMQRLNTAKQAKVRPAVWLQPRSNCVACESRA